MVNTALSKERIERLVAAAGEQLHGDWLLVGGALAAIWFAAERVTEDIDLIAIAPKSEARYELMDFALAMGLPLEAVNSAADFFVHRIPGWESEIEILHAGRNARVFRPTPTLFLILKCGRMSDADLGDCVGLLEHAQRNDLVVDRARVVAYVDALPMADSESTAMRRRTLRAKLTS